LLLYLFNKYLFELEWLIDERDVQWFVLDISALDRVFIAIHGDMNKLLSFINAQSDHQFTESDIMGANGVFLGSLEKRFTNLIPAMENTSKKYPGKVHVCVTLPYRNTSASVSFFFRKHFNYLTS
jgi:hypothetical protein